MSTIIAGGRPAWQAAGPPAARMAGRAQARAAARMRSGNLTPKKKEGISAATVARANALLSREAVLDDAINQGVISVGLRGHFAKLMEADPEGTQAHLESIGLSRTSAQTATPSENYPTSGLSSAERGRIAAAHEGRQPRVIHGGL